MANKVNLPDDRYFGPDPRQKEVAQHLYKQVANLPLICPHGHVDPRMFADPDYSFGSPADLLIIPDHYVFRMLYSQGVPMEAMGIPRKDGGKVEKNHRKVWKTFADHFHLFRATPTGMWLAHELLSVFGVEERLCGESAQRIYDQIAAKLATPEFRPRAMFERFNIEAMSTTDPATDPLSHHQAIRKSGWKGRVVPCFRPDAVVNLDAANWRKNIQALSAVSKIEVKNYKTYIAALENRRAFFKRMGATSTDHAATTAYTGELSPRQAETIFRRALAGKVTAEDAAKFTGHMLMEMARMSIEDGLVMQLHAGSFRNHNEAVFQRFGADKGADIPVAGEFTRGLRALLNKYGNDVKMEDVIMSTLSYEATRPLSGPTQFTIQVAVTNTVYLPY